MPRPRHHGRDPSADLHAFVIEPEGRLSPESRSFFFWLFVRRFSVKARLKTFANLVRDTRRMLAIAWRMDARLTLAYYLSAFVAALSPLAAGITLALLID